MNSVETGRDLYPNAFVSNQLWFVLFIINVFSRIDGNAVFVLAIQCPPPVIPLNGHLIQSEAAGMDGGRYAVGSLVQFACRGAHALEGEASIICTETGYWSHPPPFCKCVAILLHCT